MDTGTTVFDELSRKMAEMISSHDDWNEEDKTRILAEYMKTFAEVWKEAINIFNKEAESESHPITSEEQIKGTEQDLEEAEIRHEGTLIAVTKKRKEYPAKIAGLLGKTTRLQKNAVETLKVDLPPRPPLETDSIDNHLNANLATTLEESSRALSESMKSLQPHNLRLVHLAAAMDIFSNNRNNPVETLIRDYNV